MSPDDRDDMDQLDELAGELADGGRHAREEFAGRDKPEPTFAMRLRAELLRQMPAAESAGGAAEPSRPLDATGSPVERRHGQRPFVGGDRRWIVQDEIVVAAAAGEGDLARAGRRWMGAGADAAKGRSTPPETLPLHVAQDSDEAGHVIPLKAAMRWHIPTRVMPSRFIAAGLAASVAIALLAYGSGVFFTGTPPSDTVGEAIGATLVRGNSTSTLAAGMQLHNGDEIVVSSSGRATLHLGTSVTRLNSGADIKLGPMDATHVTIDQVAGRVYHRVGNGSYQVTTAGFAWNGSGGAFDLDRRATGGGGELVYGLALYREVGLTGPAVRDTVPEGSSATLVLRPDGSAASAPKLVTVDLMTVRDAWLVGNAQQDQRLGLPLGQLASLVSPEPTIEPTVEPTAEPTVDVTATPTGTPTAAPTSVPVTAPPVAPTPKPTVAGPPNLGTLTIKSNGGGSYTFTWPKYTGAGFQYYKLVYAPWGTTPTYPSSPYWACPGTPSENSWTGIIGAGDYAVRLQVVDTTSGKTIIRAQTPVIRLKVSFVATPPPTVSLGALHVTDIGNGTYTFNWSGYSGGQTYSYYKLVWEDMASGKTPSYPNGSPYWAVPNVGDTSAGPIAIDPGDYQVRIQAIGYPSGSAYAYAQTTVLTLKVPVPAPATPTPAPTLTPAPTPVPTV